MKDEQVNVFYGYGDGYGDGSCLECDIFGIWGGDAFDLIYYLGNSWSAFPFGDGDGSGDCDYYSITRSLCFCDSDSEENCDCSTDDGISSGFGDTMDNAYTESWGNGEGWGNGNGNGWLQFFYGNDYFDAVKTIESSTRKHE